MATAPDRQVRFDDALNRTTFAGVELREARSRAPMNMRDSVSVHVWLARVAGAIALLPLQEREGFKRALLAAEVDEGVPFVVEPTTSTG
jgi:hypothetical protein